MFSPASNADSSDSEPFLPTADSSSVIKHRKEAMYWRQSKWLYNQYISLLPWTIIVALVVVLFWTRRDSYQLSYCNIYFQSDGVVYSPAQHVIEPQNVLFSGGHPPRLSVYQGPSAPERDQAWRDLYSFGVSRIPRSSAARLVNKTVPIPGDSGHYVVQLSVFHQLHCLNMIRLRIWSNGTFNANKEPLMADEHISHCINSLRQSLMCAADITPMSWRWDAQAKEAKPAVDGVAHTCRNFEKVKLWAKENHLDSFDSKVFVEDVLNPQ